jgi:mRNA-degrading endonuclease RelE of RelBE toxin-antitoxin system
MSYVVQETKLFRKQFMKLSKEIRQRFNKQISRLAEDPFSIGKPLQQPWLRELKNRKYRVYYYIHKNNVIVILLALSEKKDQEKIIKMILAMIRNL